MMSMGLAQAAELLQVLGIECNNCSCLPATKTELLSVCVLQSESSRQHRAVCTDPTEGQNSRLENVAQVLDSKPCKVKTRDAP